MSWLQQKDESLYPDLLWSRPENRRHAGKLLIIGGQAGEFTNVSDAFSSAENAGAGTIRVLLPESLRKLTQMLPSVEYAPANASGSFAKSAYSEFIELDAWADHVLLAGDLGKNSETTILIEKFIEKSQSPLTISSAVFECLDMKYLQNVNDQKSAILDFTQLQKLSAEIGLTTAFTSTMPVQVFAERLGELTSNINVSLVVTRDGIIWAVANGKIVSTEAKKINLNTLAGTSAVWHMQNPDKTIEALATACYEVART